MKKKLTLNTVNKRARKMGLHIYRGKGKCKFEIRRHGPKGYGGRVACSKTIKGANQILANMKREWSYAPDY